MIVQMRCSERKFQFTHPGRGATKTNVLTAYQLGCFNSRTPGGVRLIPASCTDSSTAVSIHAPREGCDLFAGDQRGGIYTFQFTHPGRGATGVRHLYDNEDQKFQFTHPGRGATSADLTYRKAEDKFQFTHPGRGATGLGTRQQSI